MSGDLIPVEARFSTPVNRSWDPTSLLYNGYRVFPGGKERPGRDADPSPLLVPCSRKGRAIPLLPLWAYGLYKASVPVQGCTLPYCKQHLNPLWFRNCLFYTLMISVDHTSAACFGWHELKHAFDLSVSICSLMYSRQWTAKTMFKGNCGNC